MTIINKWLTIWFAIISQCEQTYTAGEVKLTGSTNRGIIHNANKLSLQSLKC